MTDLEIIRAKLNGIDESDLSRLTDRQSKFIVHDLYKSSFLKACPGSGKTEVVGIKAAYEFEKWKNPIGGMAVLSFTRNAAQEIRDRILKYSGTKGIRFPHFAGTIEAFLHEFLLHPHGHLITGYEGIRRNENLPGHAKTFGDKSCRVIESGSKATFLENSKYISYYPTAKKKKKSGEEYTPWLPVYASEYYIDESGSTTFFKNGSIEQSKQAAPDLDLKKANFLKDGFVTYGDAEIICYKLLNSDSLLLELFARRFPVIIVDECQDLSSIQISFFELLIRKGVSIHFVGDQNQAIYKFRKVDIDKFLAFAKRNNLVEMGLQENFRSNDKIAKVCSKLGSILNPNEIVSIEGKRKTHLDDTAFVWEYDKLDDIPMWFEKFVEDKNSSIRARLENLGISDWDVHLIELDNSAILARTWKVIEEIHGEAEKPNLVESFALALRYWNDNQGGGILLQKSMVLMGECISHWAYLDQGQEANYFCPNDLSSIKWRVFLNYWNDLASHDLFPFEGVIWKTWSAKLRLFLEKNWGLLPIDGEHWDKVKDRVKAPIGKGDQCVIGSLGEELGDKTNSISIETFHGVKGKTLDAVIVVSKDAMKGEGGHWKQWIGLGNSIENVSENVRFAYVASSRPKHLLVWAIPKMKGNERVVDTHILENLGFKVLSRIPDSETDFSPGTLFS